MPAVKNDALDSFTAEPKATAFPGSAVAFGSAVNESFMHARGLTEQLQPLGRQKRFEVNDDMTAAEPRWVEVNVGGVRVENLRQFGGPWLALHLIRTLELDTFLDTEIPEGREHVPWNVTSLILIIARLQTSLHRARGFTLRDAT